MSEKRLMPKLGLCELAVKIRPDPLGCTVTTSRKPANYFDGLGEAIVEASVRDGGLGDSDRASEVEITLTHDQAVDAVLGGYAKRLLDVRHAYGMSLREASRASRVDHSTIHRFEKGKEINLRAFVKLTLWLSKYNEE